MRKELKKLQLTIRNFNKKGLLFCAVFALTLQGLTAFVPRVGTYADPANSEELFEADARITVPTAGATPDMNITATDSDKYSVSIDYWYLYEGSYPNLTADSTFEEHKDYALRFVFEPKEGYSFREDTVFTLNGEATSSYGSNTSREFIFLDVQSASTPTPRTNYATTFVKTASSTEEVAWDTDLTDYINNKRIEWSNTAEGQGIDGDYRAAWEALYVMDGDTYKYPVHLATYFTGVTIDETCGGTIQVGDPNSLIGGGCATYNYRAEYEEVTVVKPTFTVSFDDGGVLSGADKIINQAVTGGETPDEPQNAAGVSLFDLLGYCYNSPYSDCYNNYHLEDFYTDPDFTTPYNGEPITQDTTIYINWIDDFEGYERIKEIDISVVLPPAGTEIVINDENDRWDSQKPQLEVTLPDGVNYHLWDEDGEFNYAYWLKGNTIEDYEPFAGIIEKGGRYYVEIWFEVNEGELAIFDENLVLKVNGVETPFEFTDYSPDSPGLMIEVNIPGDEPATIVSETGTVASPDTGVITGESRSVALAASGAVVVSVILVSLVTFLSSKEKEHKNAS